MSTTYLVTVELKTKGDLSPVMASIASRARSAQQDIDRMRGSLAASASSAGRLGSSFGAVASGAARAQVSVDRLNASMAKRSAGGGLQGSFGAARDVAMSASGAFTGFVEKAGAVALGAAAVGTAFVGRSLWTGVTQLNAELDNTKVSMAAIFNAQGMSSGMPQALNMASDQLTKMRADARALPGEFKDLANIMTSIAIPAAHAGLTPDKMREISSLLMAGGVTAGIEPGQIAREAAQLLEGRSGAHNVLGLRLAGLSGDKAESFNKSSGTDRIKVLETELKKYQPALATFEKSWAGVSSTFADNLSSVRRNATKPLFDNVLGTLGKANDWFSENQGYVNSWAEHFGNRVSYAFDRGKDKVVEWYPHFATFVGNAETRLMSMWTRIEPMAERAGAGLKRVLDDPATFDRIESVLKMYGAAKALQIGAPIVGGLGRIAGPLLGAGGGGLGAAGGALASIGPAAVVAAAGVATVAGMFWAVSQDAEKAAAMGARWQRMGDQWAPLATAVESATGRFVGAIKNQLVFELQTAADSVTIAAEGITGATFGVADFFSNLGNDIRRAVQSYGISGGAQTDFNNEMSWKRNWGSDKVDTPDRSPMAPSASLRAIDTFADAAKASKAAAAKDTKGRRSGTTIQKVEIVVSSNQDPTRIARMVSVELTSLNRHPKVSRDVRNWSAP